MARIATPRARRSRTPASAARCRGSGSRRRVSQYPRRPRARSGWRSRPRTIADGVSSARAGRSIAPRREWSGKRNALTAADAFTARILLIHHYRRVVLRDPLLPAALLPKDWPGRAARALCGDIYRALLPKSELWLDQHGTSEAGPLPKAGADLTRRF